MVVYQVLPDGHRVAATRQAQFDDFPVRLAGAGSRTAARLPFRFWRRGIGWLFGPGSVATSMAGFAAVAGFRPQPPGRRMRIPGRLQVTGWPFPAGCAWPVRIRRSDQPSRPRAITCCFFSSLKTLLTLTELIPPSGSMSWLSYLIGRFSGGHLWPVLGGHRGFEYSTTVVVETYRMKCPRCGFRAEKVPQLPSKAPFSKRFEEAVGQACESASARQVARRFGMAESTVRAIDLRCLERWEAKRRKAPLRQMGVDELYRGKRDKFLTVVCNLETGEPLWFGKTRKKETLDEFFRDKLWPRQRKRIEAACVDMWEPFRVERRTMVAAVQDRIRQVPHPPACQRCHRRSAEGGVLPSGETQARADQGKEIGRSPKALGEWVKSSPFSPVATDLCPASRALGALS